MTVPFDTSPSLIPPAAANPPFTDICLTCFRVVVLCFCMSTCTFRDVTQAWWFQGCIWKKKNTEEGGGRGRPCPSWPESISFSSNLPDGFEGLIHHYCHESGEFARTLRADPVQNGYIFDYFCTDYCFTIPCGYQHNADDGFQMSKGSTWYIGLYVKEKYIISESV